ncbi:50S ribosomal protein L19e, partial [Candidatus Woesearchaeota archaeon CG_4_10_14_0_8_um_filter_47_5]
VKRKVITRKPEKGISRARANKIARQKTKGKRKGHGSRKGKKTARTPQKEMWVHKVRLQRSFVRRLKEKKHIDVPTSRELIAKVKGGFFRSLRHLKLYVQEKGLVQKK